MAGFCKKIGNCFLHYETVKIIDIKNKKVGALYRFIQLIIIGYVIGYVIVYKKGYQEFDTAISTVTTKLKGSSYVNFTNFKSPLHHGIEVYDPADYVIPAQENNAFFVMTNMIITPNQTRGRCPEDPKFKVWCTQDADCLPELEPVRNGNGVRTGKCVPSDRENVTRKVCEVYAWCPTELDVLPMPGFSDTVPLLPESRDFTMLLKNQISFPKFKVMRRNIIDKNSTGYLKGCHHNAQTDPLCPIFKIGDIIEDCGDSFNEVAFKGAVYGILIDWQCNLDHSIDGCLPTYTVKRLDDPDAPISPGFNFRYAKYFVKDNIQSRILTKAYGLKFEILVSGKASKFSIVPLLTNLGAGLALLGIAVVWCDFMVMYCSKKRNVYKDYKYQKIDDERTTDDNMSSEEEKEDQNEEGSTSYKHLN